MQRELRLESFHLTAFGPFSQRVSLAHGSLADANGVAFFLQFGSLVPPDPKVLVHNEEEFKAIPHTIEEIWFAFPVRLLVDSEFCHSFQSLKTLVVGKQSMEQIHSFEVSGLNQLTTLIVWENCFRDGRGRCSIVNCFKLRSIQIGDNSFTDYSEVELKNLPSLESVALGVRCFCLVASFSLYGMTASSPFQLRLAETSHA